MMINSNKARVLLEELDKSFIERDRSIEIIIFGSGALLLQGFSARDRFTVDIDMVDPEMDMEFQVIAADVGEKHGLEMGWLNSAGHIFSRNFPKGWRERTQVIFEGKALKVRSLEKKDLIATKFFAYCTRGLDTDRIDMLSLQPKKSELEFAKKWIETLKPDLAPRITEKMDEILAYGRKSE